MAKIKLSDFQWTALVRLNDTACKDWFWKQTNRPNRRKSTAAYKIDRETLVHSYEDFNQANIAKGVRYGTLNKDFLFALYELFVKYDVLTPEGRNAFADTIKTL